ncbi:GNAT family N-acetyltransferase [Halorarius litoreus]|uniref:GNAT family N-acetyltransferase n=1 Tax=Halorarius litoreus TaxID=2962676 RepID=UPI0020CE32EA|nr:GNAT family N-acetyltransferase [Halorarius litoreus]
MHVREGRPEHTDAVCEIAVASWHAAYDDILGADTVAERVAEWYDPAVVRDYFDDPDVSVYVAGDPIVGYAFCRHYPAENRLHLTAIYVHPERWGEGVGSALIERVEREARALGADRVDLVVLAENDVGRGFYERHGYQQVREREETVDDARELVYEKPV